MPGGCEHDVNVSKDVTAADSPGPSKSTMMSFLLYRLHVTSFSHVKGTTLISDVVQVMGAHLQVGALAIHVHDHA